MSQQCACLVTHRQHNSRYSARDRSDIERWWQQLTPAQQAELDLYFDPRAEDLATSHTEEQQWEPLPIALRGVFFDEEELAHQRLWSQDIFDYFDDDPRRFLHDNKYTYPDKAFEWRHYNWQSAPVY